MSLDVAQRTVERVRQRLVEHGLEKTLEREPRKRSRAPQMDAEQQAYPSSKEVVSSIAFAFTCCKLHRPKISKSVGGHFINLYVRLSVVTSVLPGRQ